MSDIKDVSHFECSSLSVKFDGHSCIFGKMVESMLMCIVQLIWSVVDDGGISLELFGIGNVL